MARRSSPPRRPSSPPPAATRPAPAPRRPTPRPASAQAPLIDPQADLSATYAHVKRDLTRILVIGFIMFAIIIGSRLVL